MTLEEFQASLTAAAPPPGLSLSKLSRMSSAVGFGLAAKSLVSEGSPPCVGPYREAGP